MKRLIATLFVAALLAGGANAQDKKDKDAKADKQPSAQQQRMKDCNAQASEKSMKGDERKGFMSKCLRGEAAGKADGAEAPKRTAQQEKMAACNKQAGEKKLKGGERKSFMSDCLKG